MIRGGRVKDLLGFGITSSAASGYAGREGPQAAPFKYGAKREIASRPMLRFKPA